jgi:hypothetical protein
LPFLKVKKVNITDTSCDSSALPHRKNKLRVKTELRKQPQKLSVAARLDTFLLVSIKYRLNESKQLQNGS